MKVLSVNLSLPKDVVHKGKTVTTGIFKEPVRGRVRVRPLGLEGDAQADRRVHGGPDMAVYAYPFEHYRFWEEALGRSDFSPGQFGENLTVEGLAEGAVRVGDLFRFGSALLQVTQPRIPCFKLAIRMGEGPDFPARFQDSGRVGFYLRVREEGELGAGDDIILVERDEGSITIDEFVRVYLNYMHEPRRLRRVLAARDLGQAWRGYFEDALDEAKPVVGEATWAGFRRFVVERKVPESETIASFYLVPEDGEPLAPFKPGQYLTLRLNVPGHPRPVMRTYTLSDRPRAPYYRLTVKREPAPTDRPELPPGLSSGYFHDRVERGTIFHAKAPRGDFHLDPAARTPVVLLSAGVGLTPMVSMVNAIVEAGAERTVWFLHGARNGREHAMGAHLRRLAAAHRNLHVHVAYSDPGADDRRGTHYHGAERLDIELLRRLLPDRDFDFYLCGPTPFMRSIHGGLLSWGVPASRIRYEFFGPPKPLSPEPARRAEAAGITVTFRRSALTIPWDPAAESLLDLAETHGLRPDFGCRSGICHTCMRLLVEGEVEYNIDLADAPDPGSVLICCARPRTSVVVEV